MLTPQGIKDKKFVKAMVGGYDMGIVDDFLEEVFEDYSALYKENAVLKSKLKVLVEKIEEYRSTEDSMHMALLAAQKTSSEIEEKAKRKRDAIIAEANDYANHRRKELQGEFQAEEARLAAAKRQTSMFSQEVLALIEGERKFLARLDELVIKTEQAVPAPVLAAEPVVPEVPVPTPELVAEPEPTPVPIPAARPIAPVTPPPAVPEPQVPAFELPPTTERVSEGDLSLDKMEESVGAYLAQAVSGFMTEEPLSGTPQVPSSFFDDAAEPVPSAGTYTEEAPGDASEVEFYKLFDQDPPASTPAAPPVSVSIFEDVPTPPVASTPPVVPPVQPSPVVVPPQQNPRAAETLDIARSISATLGDTKEINVDIDAFYDDEGPPTTRRPRFDFENLQFGANYEEDE